MLSPNQDEWIASLSDEDRIKIIPLDPTADVKFEAVKQKIEAVLGKRQKVVHRGATSLGISGQDEIDIYIPVPEKEFNSFIVPLSTIFGEPHSLYPLNRARFVTQQDGKYITVFLMNNSCDAWLTGIKFENYLRSHPDTLDAYRQLKEAGDGLSIREYYRRKVEFINEILSLADKTEIP
jgi:GrpB-like predicted nucleotidyltransferase (UPF0157 family)